LSRILLFLVIGFIVYVALKGLARSRAQPPQQAASRGPRGEDMVSCARCGVNLPRSEAREEGGRLVCHDSAQCR
jgi:uncharacterized protein